MAELATYLAIGAAVGFLAGLLGVGGGFIIVSSLALIFAAQGFPPQYVMHLAIGTSLAAIIFGSASSLRAHHRHGAVEWGVVKGMVPGILAGVVLGALVARLASTQFLKVFFLAFLVFIAAQMLLDLRPRLARPLPGALGLNAMGLVIGTSSSLFGGGAAAVGVPFLTWRGLTIHRAIGTAAALGFPIAVTGTLAYIAAGMDAVGLPRWSVGFVYVPAFVGISITSVLAAPFGARLAHRLKGPMLRRAFALFILAVGAKVAISV